MATLREFLQTGELGPIHLGMSESEALSCLGPPQDESITRHPKILKYGGLQLTFIKGSQDGERRLVHIGLYVAPRAEPIPEPALPTDFQLTPETTIDEFQDFLSRAGLKEFAVDEADESSTLILPSGSSISFDAARLQSINFAARTPRNAKKQISISVPMETWDQLKSLARNSRVSVSELCSEWISERANEVQNETPGKVGSAR